MKNHHISESLRLMQPQNKRPWLGTVPSFFSSALRAVVVFVERKRTPLEQKEDEMEIWVMTSLITHILNFHSSGAFQTLLRASNRPDMPVPQKKERLQVFQKDAAIYLPFTLPSFASITSLSNCSLSHTSDLCPCRTGDCTRP